MKRMKKLIATALVAIMASVTLAGCGKEFDAGTYVTACLDLLTKGETKDYVKMTKRSEEQAVQDYEDNIDSMMESMGAIGLSEDLTEGYEQLFKDIYKKSKYEVTNVEKMKGEDGFYVTVEVEQMTGLFSGVEEQLMTEVEDYVANIGDEMPSDEEINEVVFQMMLDIMQDKLSDVTYKDAQEVVVEVVGNDGVYSITDEGYQLLDAALLDTEM